MGKKDFMRLDMGDLIPYQVSLTAEDMRVVLSKYVRPADEKFIRDAIESGNDKKIAKAKRILGAAILNYLADQG